MELPDQANAEETQRETPKRHPCIHVVTEEVTCQIIGKLQPIHILREKS